MAYPDWPKPKAGENLVPDMYGVKIIPAQATSGFVYRAGVRKLTGAENNSNHNVYLDVLDENGNRIQWARINWNWQGNSGTPPTPAVLDKPANEPKDIALFGGMKVWVQLEGSFPADRVEYFSIDFPDTDPGNTWGHHSYLVVYHKVPVGTQPDPDPEPEPDPDPVVQADFDYSPKNPVVGQKMTFTNLSQNSASVLWVIGGNAVGNINNPTYTPQVTGDFDVRLTAKSETGEMDTKTETITVGERTPTPPIEDDVGGIECFSYRDVYTVVSKIGGLTATKPLESELTAGYIAIFVDKEIMRQMLNDPANENRSFLTFFAPTLEEKKYNALYREENESN